MQQHEIDLHLYGTAFVHETTVLGSEGEVIGTMKHLVPAAMIYGRGIEDLLAEEPPLPTLAPHAIVRNLPAYVGR